MSHNISDLFSSKMSRPWNRKTEKLAQVRRNQGTTHLKATWESGLDPGPGKDEKNGEMCN